MSPPLGLEYSSKTPNNQQNIFGCSIQASKRCNRVGKLKFGYVIHNDQTNVEFDVGPNGTSKGGVECQNVFFEGSGIVLRSNWL